MFFFFFWVLFTVLICMPVFPNIKLQTRGPSVLYSSPECIGYAELEQAWIYMTICCISFTHAEALGNKFWLSHKNGRQYSVIIWTNLVVLEYPFSVYQVSKSSACWFQRRRFFKVFTIYRPGSHLGHVTQNIWTHFHPNIPWRLHMKFGFKRPCVFSLGKEVW